MKKDKIKILWIVSFPLPAVSHLIGGKKIPFGGWVTTMLNELKSVEEFDIYVAMKSPVDSLKKENIDNITYFLLPQSKSDRFDVYQKDCDYVLDTIKPDILHAEGTEGTHTYRFLSTFKGKNIVSMQGILNGYEPYEYGHLPVADMIATLSGQSALMSIALIANKMLFFKKRVKKEIKTIKLAQNILGRTTWDRAHSYAINPQAKYYLCYRILREPFYHTKWDINKIKRHTIFIGNSFQPRKGAHIVFQAVAQLKNQYPDIQIIIAGEKPQRQSIKEWKKIIGYPAYLQNLAKKLDIQSHIQYTGVLQANQMAEKMAQSHLCVLSSIIENSPNTLGEAMIMGVPAISAYVGGASDMAIDGKEALFYRDDDPMLLAYAIKRVFDDDSLALSLSVNAKARAAQTHDPKANRQRMIDAYKDVFLKDRDE
jgi:glycosyltransferase involved in cell wall biosynthesis